MPNTPPITSIEFHNFRALRNATLPLDWFTLLIGPNGSGKSTALAAFECVRDRNRLPDFRSAGGNATGTNVRLVFQPGDPLDPCSMALTLVQDGSVKTDVLGPTFPSGEGARMVLHAIDDKNAWHRSVTTWEKDVLRNARVFAFDPVLIAQSSHAPERIELQPNGGNLAGVLDRLLGRWHKRFEELEHELHEWLPEFDSVIIEPAASNAKRFGLSTTPGGHTIPASALSHGTLTALALLTLTHLPEPPPVICIEEPDRGLHPRLLREVGNALYCLAHPEDYGEKRAPVQVIVTTHSPFFLDVFRDRRECIVLADKQGGDVRFTRLSDLPDIEEIIGDAPLSEVWYSGILGGVPAGT